MKEYPHLYFHFGWGKSGRYWGWTSYYKGMQFGHKSCCKVTKRAMREDAADYVAEINRHGN